MLGTLQPCIPHVV
jgi:hypothetical protein